MRPAKPGRVLIETYWNVNEDIHYLIDNDLIVLIETYWNVNFVAVYGHPDDFRINRNILECKLAPSDTQASSDTVLIETYWNVNSRHEESYICCHLSINRNILECK